MFNLIPLSLLIMALGGFIYIVSDHLSEFEESDEATDSGFSLRAKLAGWVNQLPLDNVKAQSLSFTQKLLHRMRIILLKTDNYLMKLISKISKKNKVTNQDDSNENGANFWQDLANGTQKAPQKEISESEPAMKVDLTFKSNPETEKFFDIKPGQKNKRIKKSPR